MTNTLKTGNDKPLLTVKEAASQLRISKWTLNKLIQRKELTSLKIRSRRFVAVDDLAEFINQCKEVET